MRYLHLIISFGFILVVQTALAQSDTGDLSVHASEEINDLLKQRKDYNKSLKTYQGFRIQIYYGSEKECYELKEEFSTLFPEIPTSIVFSTPQWKLQVGEYRTRLEADKAIVTIKAEYPSAIVLASDIEYK